MLALVGGLEANLEAFWAAPTVAERDLLAHELVEGGASFEEVHRALAAARRYEADVPTGKLFLENEVGGVRHPFVVLVHEDYSPDEPWPVRVDLHGGMGAEEWQENDGSWNPGWRPVPGQIVVLPAGWWDSMWWEASQVENLERILRRVRATWNVDENRAVLAGASDGGAALFFQAMRTPDAWAGYAGFVAPPDRLTRLDFRPDGQMHLANLSGQRFHLGYGERDHKVPLKYIERYMTLFEEAGARLDWYVLEGQGHSLRLPAEREQDFARFLWGAVRDPFPDELTWATEDPQRYGRRLWLLIDELAGSREVDEGALLPRLGTSLQLRGPTVARVPFGRVSLRREGQTVHVEVQNVARFRLLLSPQEFDLKAPVRVVDGERILFEGRVEPSLETLLHWAARDDDRRRFVAAELEITL